MLRHRHHHRLLVVDALGLCVGACYYLDVSHSTVHQSTFVCPSVVDAPPCSSIVLSCGWWSVDVDAVVSDPITLTFDSWLVITLNVVSDYSPQFNLTTRAA
jgi:hypothetical protein